MKVCSLLLIVILISSFVNGKSPSKECKRQRKESNAPKYCKEPHQPHLGCVKRIKWAETCGKGPELFPVKKLVQKFILRQHNFYRNNVAKGTLPNLPPAARMLKLKWDKNFADLAEIAVMRCTIKPIAESISSIDYPHASYLSAFNKFPVEDNQHAKDILKSQLKYWYDQYKFITEKKLRAHGNKKDTSHFLQLIVGENNRVGCALSKYQKGSYKYLLMFCLYGKKKQKGTATYEVGKEAAAKCKCGKDKDFKFLCDEQEPVNEGLSSSEEEEKWLEENEKSDKEEDASSSDQKKKEESDEDDYGDPSSEEHPHTTPRPNKPESSSETDCLCCSHKGCGSCDARTVLDILRGRRC